MITGLPLVRALPGAGAVLAHGVGTRADLPLPLSYVVVGGGLAVLVSFVALGALWRTPRLRGADAGRPVPPAVLGLVAGRDLRALLRSMALALTVLVIVVAFFGDPSVAGNAAPHRSDPRRDGLFLTGYAVVHLVAAVLTGETWFSRGDGFEVYSRLFGALAPIGRRRDGVMVFRNPLDGVAAVPLRRGLAAVVLVLVGSTAFAGLTRTLWWQGWVGGISVGGISAGGISGAGEVTLSVTTAGLAATIALVALLYAAATTACGRLGGYRGAAARFAHSVVPIAAGYAIAHYFSLLVFDGQFSWILLSDPFGTGLDLLGLRDASVDYTVLTARAIAGVQVGAIVGGHVVGVVLAHDRALALAAGASGQRRPVLSQVPLLTLMVTLTVGALLLLLGG